jgi:hypothetical protein
MPSKNFAAMMLLAGLAACATPVPQRIADSSCLVFKAISYAQLPVGVMDDAGNRADSDATVAEIESHNARLGAVCPGK